MSRSGWVAAVLLLAVLSAHPARAAGGADQEGWRTYRPPTRGAVVDPFRPPPEPWLPGNRGIEYATEPGSALLAVGPGRVAFAGQVGGRLVVSIVHPDGLRSSLTGVAAIAARVGDVVWAGAPVAVAGERTHLGVRRGDAYLDPASLWGTLAGAGAVRLVPLDDPEPASGSAAGRLGRDHDLLRALQRW